MPADAPAPTPMVTLPRDIAELALEHAIDERRSGIANALRAALDAPTPTPCEHGADDCNAAYYRREWESACERVAASGCREDEAKADLSYAIRRAEKAEAERDRTLAEAKAAVALAEAAVVAAEAERDALLKVPGNRLVGYRELGAKVAAAEAARDEALGKARFWAGLKPALDNERAYHAAARERVAALERALRGLFRRGEITSADWEAARAAIADSAAPPLENRPSFFYDGAREALRWVEALSFPCTCTPARRCVGCVEGDGRDAAVRLARKKLGLAPGAPPGGGEAP